MIEKVIRINKDASLFFKALQQKATSFELKSRMAGLYEVHKTIVQNLKMYKLQKTQSQELREDLDLENSFDNHIFSNRLPELQVKNDLELIDQMEEAEEQAEGLIKNMVRNTEILKPTKEVIGRQMLYLKRSFEYFKSLKTVKT